MLINTIRSNRARALVLGCMVYLFLGTSNGYAQAKPQGQLGQKQQHPFYVSYGTTLRLARSQVAWFPKHVPSIGWKIQALRSLKGPWYREWKLFYPNLLIPATAIYYALGGGDKGIPHKQRAKADTFKFLFLVSSLLPSPEVSLGYFNSKDILFTIGLGAELPIIGLAGNVALEVPLSKQFFISLMGSYPIWRIFLDGNDTVFIITANLGYKF